MRTETDQATDFRALGPTTALTKLASNSPVAVDALYGMLGGSAKEMM
jgi:hypothetical protein